MPVIKMEGPKLTEEQCKAIVEGFTDVACRVIPNIPRQAYTVYLLEYPDEKVGVGGQLLPDYIARMQKNE
jgi:phenylpyruvate tautomerase PptA (4-oxalocrotonate tautomerase family)